MHTAQDAVTKYTFCNPHSGRQTLIVSMQKRKFSSLVTEGHEPIG